MDAISINLSNPKRIFTSEHVEARVNIFSILMGEDTKQLHRSRHDRIFAGVGGGLGEYLGFDPIVFRVLLILLAVFGNPLQVILVYLALVIVIPDEQKIELAEAETIRDPLRNFFHNLTRRTDLITHHTETARQWFERNRNTLGIVLTVAGVCLLWAQLFELPWLNHNLLWAGILLAFGLYIVVKTLRYNGHSQIEQS